MHDNSSEAVVRLDQWLHAARFFKTRALAAVAIRAGRVTHNHRKVKPAQNVRPGDTLTVRRGEEHIDCVVRVLSKRRGPAKVAMTLYSETPDSQERRADQQDRRRFSSYFAPSPNKRPDKKSRRQLIDFQRGKE